MIAALFAQGAQVTWIKVPRPTFDLVGVLVSSLSLTGIMAAITLCLGGAVGLALIRRRSRQSPNEFAESLSLHLLADAPRP
jgi:hypothetical protein